MLGENYTDEEIARRGDEIYNARIRRLVEHGNEGKILVMDIETGDYDMDEDHLKAVHRMLARRPGAVLYSVRIGYPAVEKIGSWGPTRA